MDMLLVQILVGIIIVLFIIVVIFIIFIVLTNNEPEKIIKIHTKNNQSNKLKLGKTISLTTFNIGYCGLDKGQDFFMDGGIQSRSRSKEQTIRNLDSIIKFLMRQNSDIYMIQEIDIKASRSCNVNELDTMRDTLRSYGSNFARNYKCSWVPVPIIRPMGYVESGIVTFSKYNIESSTRYQLPGRDKWIRQLFLLDRCVSESILCLDNGRKLVLLNLHLSAFDDGSVRAQQVDFLKKYMVDKYNEGSYVILGGDWNHFLLEYSNKKENWVQKLPDDFLPKDWKWGVDSKVPTVRANGTKYIEGVSYTTVIDGFLVSPNVDIVQVNGNDLGFENSDHNPVTMKFSLI